MNKNFTSLVGIPYRKMNCWDLCVKFYQLVFGLNLQRYYESDPESRDETKSLIQSHVGDFVKVDDPQFGDLILIKMYGIESHIAIYLGNGQMFHSSILTGSVIDRLAKWEKVITGYYRHREVK